MYGTIGLQQLHFLGCLFRCCSHSSGSFTSTGSFITVAVAVLTDCSGTGTGAADSDDSRATSTFFLFVNNEYMQAL